MRKNNISLVLGLSVFLAACAHKSIPDQGNLSPAFSKNSQIAGAQSNKFLNSNTSSASNISSQMLESQPLSDNKNIFIQQVAQRYAIPIAEVRSIVNSAKFNATTSRLMTPHKRGRIKRAWQTYRNRVVEPIRIRAGNKFWNNNQRALQQAEKQYHVPASIIASIIGVETVYGRNMGNIRVLDALYTLGFNHPDPNRPERHVSFRNQLAALIALHHQGKLNAYTETGSFAGAIGLPQFMPLSILHFAVDADGDGKIDLRHSPRDAIFSVANFLVQHGWQKDMPVFAPATLSRNPASMENNSLHPTLTWAQLQAQGSQSNIGHATWQRGKILGLINLKDEVRGTNEYRIGTQNFFTITKYNNSYFYAASVADFAATLQKKR